MKRFAALFAALDRTTKTGAKVTALADYFRTADDADRLWTIALLSGRRPKRAVNATRLAEWAAEAAGLPFWLFEESYAMVGDLAETIALLLPAPKGTEDLPLSDWIARLRDIALMDEPARKQVILGIWDRLGGEERFIFNKLITGGFRMGVSQGLMTRALAEATGVEEATLAHRLMGGWTPDTTTFARLVLEPDPEADLSRPYPFCLASPLEGEAVALGPPADWIAEWKWDGIRGQLIRRGGAHFLWSRGEELVTDRFPELARALDFLPDGTVIDGEILAWEGEAPLPFSALQTRIGRKTLSRKVLNDAPVVLLAYDLLEAEGRDIRDLPLSERRAALEALVGAMPPDLPLHLSPLLAFDGWDSLPGERDRARAIGAEGLMLKRLASPYTGGRKRGDWWKWKVDPMTVDAVMIYAQAGHGRRATLYTDFTFAVRDGNELVPFTKAYSGLTDAEFRKISQWVRSHTLERFGPVRRVPPELVFEIGFEGIQPSPRHKSGIALRFPRMLRWRQDKPVSEIDTLDTLRALLAEAEARPAPPG
ncbi:ATP-dependent DNA ligase [Haematobacter genomosp. 1]|uniref:DNA ligase (ATP) n=1 Tax=Haematobacter genomosp. 1 TaxID=366618 RepID=A0A212A919_9RHOB|nr:ATP-dependent DNA ligase [Haematobacter genomosp. 1]OWJ76358.1 ATP-dependent DNA ligase [Haematobacter genomosp. 1]